jgi:triacylglycerol lipase
MEQTQQPIKAKKAYQLTLRSKKNNNVSKTSEIARSLLLSELSMISYLPPKQAKIAAVKLGFPDTLFFDNDGSQAYSFANKMDIIIAFRGTEPNEWNDLKADMNAIQALADTVGKVHRGFKKEVDDLWPLLEKMLTTNTKNLWFTGHSLGGAMATICAGRCLLSNIESNPIQIQTFGSPRVGNRRYINHAKVDYLRWVNNNDIVTRSPPVWLGYRHTGKEMYLNSEGRLKQLSLLQRRKDMWKGFVKGIMNKEIDHFNDHSIDQYIEYLFYEVQQTCEL